MITIKATKYTEGWPGKSVSQKVELSLAELYSNFPVVTPVSIGDFSIQNKDSVIIPAGSPCSLHPSGVGLLLAKANSPALWAFGLAASTINPTFAGVVKTTGLLTLSDWSNVTGTVGLVAKAIYYLAPGGGLSTEIAGQILQQIGVAVAPDTLDIQVCQPILL